MNNYLYGSVCRISDIPKSSFEVTAIDKSHWDTGDYVVGQVSERPSHEARIEAPSGRTIEPLEGEWVVGALGKRYATRGIVGDWRDINEQDGTMDVIGGGGIVGRLSSISTYLHQPIKLQYEGHVHLNDHKTNMENYAKSAPDEILDTPVILVLGTSMSSGKTMSARVITRALKELGRDPAACKLSGSGRYHDVLSMKDAGAKNVFDFVDAGLPTTVVPTEDYEPRIKGLLGEISTFNPDVLVVEIGASPLEPYNGSTAIEMVKPLVDYTVLTASDPYSVVGLRDQFDITVDLVSGIATNTEAGIDLIHKLTDVEAINLQDESAKLVLEDKLGQALE